MNIQNNETNLCQTEAKKHFIYPPKKIIDLTMEMFLSKISKIEENILKDLDNTLEIEITPESIMRSALLIKTCNALLDMKKKQLLLRRMVKSDPNKNDNAKKEFMNIVNNQYQENKIV